MERPSPGFSGRVGQETWDNVDTRGGSPFWINKVFDVDGFNSSSVTVAIGDRPCTGVQIEDDGVDAATGAQLSRVSCTMPAGVGVRQPVVISTPGGNSLRDTGPDALVVN